MELFLAAIAVWLLVAGGMGVLLGRSARDAEVADLASGPVLEPAAGDPRSTSDLGVRAG